MVARLGMSDTFGMVALETVQNRYLGGDTSLACSQETAREIDRQIIQIVKEQHDKAMELLSSHMKDLHRLARHLLERETITGEEFMQLLEKN